MNPTYIFPFPLKGKTLKLGRKGLIFFSPAILGGLKLSKKNLDNKKLIFMFQFQLCIADEG